MGLGQRAATGISPAGCDLPSALRAVGALLTNGPAGLLRWPVHADPKSAGVVRIGPPQRLPLPGSGGQIAQSKDGRVLASSQPDGALVWHRDHPDHFIHLGPHPDVRSVSVSPDGRWVATGSHNGAGCKVWDAQTGQLVKELMPNEGMINVCFSPDGHWLGAGNSESYRLWATGS